MIIKEAIKILQSHIDENKVPGWNDIIGKQIFEILHPITGEVFAIDEGEYCYEVFSIPSDMDFNDVLKLSKEEQSDYRYLLIISKNGVVYEPEV